MIFRYLLMPFFLLFTGCAHAEIEKIPDLLVDVQKLDSSIVVDLKYLGGYNFLGRPVVGYKKNKCYLAKQAAEALVRVQKDLRKNGYTLRMFDCTRPQRAVDDFVQWSKDLNDQKMKNQFYPDLNKSKLFELGYIANKSGHTRGATVDLTIAKTTNGQQIDLDMGGPYDFFGEVSHTASNLINAEQKKNRELLVNAMKKQGFQNYLKEWWHFTLKPEPYPTTYFDFVVQ